jgi:4-hydroxybenzoate polyprenyltransferase/phosphoserine phosphatase
MGGLMEQDISAPIATRSDPAAALPLCVDMDGTLLRIDTLQEAALAALLAGPRTALGFATAILSGDRTTLKRQAAAVWAFDPATLPYSAAVLEMLERERAAGRTIVLCTATHRRIAEKVADHLGLFDAVIATDEAAGNLRGPRKREALERRFGRGGFVYMGNDTTDLAVWEGAGGAVVVNASGGLARQTAERTPVLAELRDAKQGAALRAGVRAMRPHQWVKNALCLVPPLAAADFGAAAWLGAITAMLAFCLMASGIYIANDLSDLAADRAHPRKSRRPFASGALPVAAGVLMAPLLILGGAILGWSAGVLGILLIYGAASLAYSLGLKEQPLVDVFMLAGLYTIRLFGGGEASGHPVSLWLLGFSGFLFLALALVKRVSELKQIDAARGGRVARRGYAVEDLAILQSFGSAATFASAVVLSLYVQSDTALRAYAAPEMLWGCVPLLLLWQCRLWLSTARGYMHDDPIVYASRDWVSWCVFGCLAVLVVLAWGLGR